MMMPSTAARDARGVQRVNVRTHASVREQSTHRLTADLLDLSVTGFRLSSTSTMSVGARIFVTLPELGGLESVVEWRDGDIYGCSFVRPLHPSVRDHLADRYPGPSAI
ncbi:PilZ domain-containing protein [Sphingomonas sp. LaA6.9]|uniref:PilZ domain-containing protein n=1 Tax=Sphingomonas sp. LaA6.9 TaxID=2919914 RepID=UPI001F4FB9CB|nr:PilZ domain-containing protein [Sphingomonas sp. LaA6.9]MCJ8156443.1 PilZ domain-containing protein [Sphingomonas sp. LaA6.9]